MKTNYFLLLFLIIFKNYNIHLDGRMSMQKIKNKLTIGGKRVASRFYKKVTTKREKNY